MSIKIKNKTECTGCQACVSVCPKRCITMKADNEGFFYPSVEINKCINCDLCTKICPIVNNRPIRKDECGTAYAVWNRDDFVRIQSSSGGVFSAIADYVFSKGGSVFGAAFNKDFDVETISVDSKIEMDKLRGSKYVQSNIGESYIQAKSYLDDGIFVLFSGTPCQIAGLYSYLGKNYDNLLTIDLICHGVPSPLVWKKYIEYQKSQASGDIISVSFRHKKYGWKKFSMCIVFDNHTQYIQDLSSDKFMNVFLNNDCLRPSCYECKFKTKDRQADITLADFWGVCNVFPEIDDDKGISLIVVHSSKGEQVFGKISESVYCKKTEIEYCNYCYLHSVDKPKEREFFLKKISKKDFRIAYNKLIIKQKRKKLKNEYQHMIKVKSIDRAKRFVRKGYNAIRRQNDT